MIVRFPSQPPPPSVSEVGSAGQSQPLPPPAGQVVADKPTCKRCRDVSSICEYPPPPDRKLLAAQRTRNAKLRTLQRQAEAEAAATAAAANITTTTSGITSGTASGTALSAASQDEMAKPTGIRVAPGRTPSNETTSAPASNSLPPRAVARHPSVAYDPIGDRRRFTPNGSPTFSPPTISSPSDGSLFRTTLPTPTVARYLFEVYFSHLYNASLLFHKQSLIDDYFAGRTPEFLALTVFAAASIFLRVPTKQLALDSYVPEPDVVSRAIVDCNRFSSEWGIVAGRQVLMHSDEPCLETIQACQNLTLYWFSLDLKDRTHIYTHLAYRTGRLLGFHVPSITATDTDKVFGEIKRRCFWSAWITNCISQENAPFKGESWREVIGLPLPCDEASFAQGVPESTEAFDETGNIVSLDGSPRVPRLSIIGEFIKLYSLWYEIQRFVKDYATGPSKTASSNIAVLFALDRQLELVWENLHSDFRYRSPASFKTSKLGPYNLFLLNCLHQLCSCVLHSSIVPIFSNTVYDEQISRKIIRMSAEEAVKHSMHILNMATAFLNTQPDKSRITSIVGYAMYAASSVQFKSLVAQGKLRTYGTSRFTAAVAIMEQLKEYWQPLRGLWSQLDTSFRSAGINLKSLSANPGRDRDLRHLAEQSTDFDRIASHTALPPPGGTSDICTYITGQEPKGSSPAVAQSSSRGFRGESGQPLTHYRDNSGNSDNSGRNVALPDESAQRTGSATEASLADPDRQPPPEGNYMQAAPPMQPVRMGRPEQMSPYDGQPSPGTFNMGGMMVGPDTAPMQQTMEGVYQVSRMLPPASMAAQRAPDMTEIYDGITPPSVASELMMGDASAWWDQSDDGGPAPLPFLLGGLPGAENWGYVFPPG
ncbi:hypothetical protein SEUCBS140593_008512 [Sporothrix eucalyptigena]|uniref:Xylanolytic transcriptional activator regulatory domain-containing protein n=1 Tax=Sporothrix eucalyptigena TaxID=1812306 RepID=A0ABP0CM36_9PEZI